MNLTFAKKLRRFSTLAVCAALLVTNFACCVTVIPPINPTDPTVIYLCDYGVHSSLLLPVSRGRYVEYLYGDWNWAALSHTSWLDAIGAIFWSGQATLGRRYIVQSGNVAPVPSDGPKTQIAITVNGDDCRKIVNQMAARWEPHRATALIPEPSGPWFSFVKDDQHYSWLHDCNLNTADSLAAMGCQIKGYAVWSNFKVSSAGSTPP